MVIIDIIIYEKFNMILKRMTDILGESNAVIHKAATITEFQRILKETTDKARLIIADIDGEMDDGLPFLHGLIAEAGTNPIIILTSNTRKNFIIKAVLEGATDFVLKPFDNKAFYNKICAYLSSDFSSFKKSPNGIELITFNLSRYLSGELKKSRKGNYAVSLMFSSYMISEHDKKVYENSLIEKYIYDNIREIFWDTDIFIRFGSRYYMGVFPFCDVGNTKIIDNKIHESFNNIKVAHPKLNGCNIHNTFVTFPIDADEPQALFDVLLGKVNMQINEDIVLKINEDIVLKIDDKNAEKV